ncbi:early activation antigen CD69-like [Hypanus sabinus]|uniref:early activation antigen CD69-like n=1 Tax=Hypanus sabinus TaxID=79690 RepID=UPI0028C39A55|nr:early activation antigen CD69-like [Hypanus sabinus]
MEAEDTYENIEDLSSQRTREALKPERRDQQWTNMRRKQSPRIIYTLVAISIVLSVLALGTAVIRITKMASEFNSALNGFQIELSWWKYNVSENFEKKHNSVIALQAEISLLKEISENFVKNRNSVIALQTEISLLKENLPSCSKQWIQFKQNCYLFSPNKETWEKANASCASRKAHLMVVNNAAEEEFLRKAIHYNFHWIGLTYTHGSMQRWVDGTDYSLSNTRMLGIGNCNWFYSDCCTAITSQGQKICSCFLQYHSICEKPAE